MKRVLAPLLAAALLAPGLLAPGAAQAQTPAPRKMRPEGAQGQQRNQPIPNLNQSQRKADRSEQPPEVVGVTPKPGASRPPEPTFTR